MYYDTFIIFHDTNEFSNMEKTWKKMKKKWKRTFEIDWSTLSAVQVEEVSLVPTIAFFKNIFRMFCK